MHAFGAGVSSSGVARGGGRHPLQTRRGWAWKRTCAALDQASSPPMAGARGAGGFRRRERPGRGARRPPRRLGVRGCGGRPGRRGAACRCPRRRLNGGSEQALSERLMVLAGRPQGDVRGRARRGVVRAARDNCATSTDPNHDSLRGPPPRRVVGPATTDSRSPIARFCACADPAAGGPLGGRAGRASGRHPADGLPLRPFAVSFSPGFPGRNSVVAVVVVPVLLLWSLGLVSGALPALGSTCCFGLWSSALVPCSLPLMAL